MDFFSNPKCFFKFILAMEVNNLKTRQLLSYHIFVNPYFIIFNNVVS